jgi:Sodium/calcium exchanger protein
MSLTILQFVVSAAVIVIAGTYLTRYADAIADLTGLGRLLVGSILLAGATSFPELSVDLSAVRLGEVDMAVGNLIGSSLFNLLILGILDLSHHSRGRMLARLRCSCTLGYLEAGGTIEKAQQIAAHESPKTTKLYDRTEDQISLDEIERIAIWWPGVPLLARPPFLFVSADAERISTPRPRADSSPLSPGRGVGRSDAASRNGRGPGRTGHTER